MKQIIEISREKLIRLVYDYIKTDISNLIYKNYDPLELVHEFFDLLTFAAQDPDQKEFELDVLQDIMSFFLNNKETPFWEKLNSRLEYFIKAALYFKGYINKDEYEGAEMMADLAKKKLISVAKESLNNYPIAYYQTYALYLGKDFKNSGISHPKAEGNMRYDAFKFDIGKKGIISYIMATYFFCLADPEKRIKLKLIKNEVNSIPELKKKENDKDVIVRKPESKETLSSSINKEDNSTKIKKIVLKAKPEKKIEYKVTIYVDCISIIYIDGLIEPNTFFGGQGGTYKKEHPFLVKVVSELDPSLIFSYKVTEPDTERTVQAQLMKMYSEKLGDKKNLSMTNSQYEGQLDPLGSFAGYGKYKFVENGEINRYEGYFFDNKPNGEGQYTFPDGKIYKGYFYNGKFYGIGSIKWPNGKSYLGNFYKNSRNGYGKIIYENGESYAGPFEYGLESGNGIYTYKDGTTEYQMWNNGKFIKTITKEEFNAR